MNEIDIQIKTANKIAILELIIQKLAALQVGLKIGYAVIKWKMAFLKASANDDHQTICSVRSEELFLKKFK